MNMNYCHPITMYENIFAQMYVFLIEKYYLQSLHKNVFMLGDLTSSVRGSYCMDFNIPFIHSSQKTVFHVHVNIFA